MGQGRATETELMLKLVVDYTELGGSKLKKWKGFSGPNFGVGPEGNWLAVVVRPLWKSQKSCGQTICWNWV